MRTTRLLTCLLAGAAVALGGCGGRKAKPRLGEVERLPSLETVYPQYTSERISVDLLATVEPFEKADLCSQVQGEVRDLRDAIDIDRAIKKGEVLARLDVPALQAEQQSKDAFRKQAQDLLAQARKAREVAAQELKESEARVARYKADLDFRELALQRVRDLAARNAVQPQLREESELQRNAAKAAYAEARAQILTKQAKLEAADAEIEVAVSREKVAQADYRLAKAKVEFATIKAPFDGVITKRWVDNGATIKDPTMPLLTVMRTDVVRVLVDIPERYAPLVRASEGSSAKGQGTPVELRFSVDTKEGKPYGETWRITRKAPGLDNASRLLRAEIHLKNPGRQIAPGMTGKATVILDDGSTKRLTIPSTALVRVGNEIRVYYIANPRGNPLRGEVKSAVVTLGLDNGKTVEVKSGLTSKELVIAKGNGVLAEGTAIAVELRETKH